MFCYVMNSSSSYVMKYVFSVLRFRQTKKKQNFKRNRTSELQNFTAYHSLMFSTNKTEQVLKVDTKQTPNHVQIQTRSNYLFSKQPKCKLKLKINLSSETMIPNPLILVLAAHPHVSVNLMIGLVMLGLVMLVLVMLGLVFHVLLSGTLFELVVFEMHLVMVVFVMHLVMVVLVLGFVMHLVKIFGLVLVQIRHFLVPGYI